jgi:hypothetical protein
MNTPEKRIIKPASEDPEREAKGHPNGPSLMEMLARQEDRKLRGKKPQKQKPEDPDIPII